MMDDSGLSYTLYPINAYLKMVFFQLLTHIKASLEKMFLSSKCKNINQYFTMAKLSTVKLQVKSVSCSTTGAAQWQQIPVKVLMALDAILSFSECLLGGICLCLEWLPCSGVSVCFVNIAEGCEPE